MMAEDYTYHIDYTRDMDFGFIYPIKKYLVLDCCHTTEVFSPQSIPVLRERLNDVVIM